MNKPRSSLSVIAALVALSLCLLSPMAFASISGAAQKVEIQASVKQRLVFSLDSSESVTLVADPVDNPTAEAESSFSVSTNVGSYSIAANFGAFEVGKTSYGLIEEENFKVMSKAPGSGQPISDWTVPPEEISVLSGENGYTNAETTEMLYQLNVDFSVPTGSASTTIVFTATASM